MRIINRIVIRILMFYKKYVSPGLNSGCIFTPTCSIYAIEAFEKHNFIVGFFLTIWRILRCNSFNKGGFDPVPDNRNKIKWLYWNFNRRRNFQSPADKYEKVKAANLRRKFFSGLSVFLNRKESNVFNEFTDRRDEHSSVNRRNSEYFGQIRVDL